MTTDEIPLGKYMVATLHQTLAFLSGRFKVFNINSKSGATLGVVEWYTTWRHYAFWPEPDTLFNSGCLRDLADFLEKLDKEKRLEGDKP